MLQGVFIELRVNPVGADPCVRPENTANIFFTVVGACIARPLIGNEFFLKQIGMIGQLG